MTLVSEVRDDIEWRPRSAHETPGLKFVSPWRVGEEEYECQRAPRSPDDQGDGTSGGIRRVGDVEDGLEDSSGHAGAGARVGTGMFEPGCLGVADA